LNDADVQVIVYGFFYMNGRLTATTNLEAPQIVSHIMRSGEAAHMSDDEAIGRTIAASKTGARIETLVARKGYAPIKREHCVSFRLTAEKSRPQCKKWHFGFKYC
jgi:predicted alpha/beta-hydrolase family hydrolase